MEGEATKNETPTTAVERSASLSMPTLVNSWMQIMGYDGLP